MKIGLNVWNFTIPEERHISVNMGQWDPSDEMLSSFDSHRINSYGFFTKQASSKENWEEDETTHCYLNQTTHEWTFNWTRWDAEINRFLAGGSTAFSVQHPYGTPDVPLLWTDSSNTTYTDWAVEYGTFYEVIASHLDDKLVNDTIDWYQYAYIYFLDEFQMFTPPGWVPGEYHILIEQFLHLLNNSAPAMKIMTTTPPTRDLEAIRPYIDIYCPITADYDEEEWEAVQNEGKELWMYPCVGPMSPWPNSHLYNRLFEIRVLFWQSYYYNLDGFLYWASAAYFHGQYGMGYNGWGDGWFVYTNPDGTVDASIRWENYRDAIEDYEYLWVLNNTLELSGADVESFHLLDQIVTGVATDRYNYCDSGLDLWNSRNEVGSWIHSLVN